MEVDGVAAALQHHTAQVVIEQIAGHSAQIMEGAYMSAQKVFQRLIEKEFQVEGARIRQGEHKAREASACSADGDLAKVSPIDLCLLSGECAQAQESFPRHWAQLANSTSQLRETPRITARLDHLVDAGGAQARMFLQRFSNKVQIRLGLMRDLLAAAVIEPIRLQRTANRIPVQSQLGGNGPHLPVLGKEESTDFSDQFGSDHVCGQSKESIHRPTRPQMQQMTKPSLRVGLSVRVSGSTTTSCN